MCIAHHTLLNVHCLDNNNCCLLISCAIAGSATDCEFMSLIINIVRFQWGQSVINYTDYEIQCFFLVFTNHAAKGQDELSVNKGAMVGVVDTRIFDDNWKVFLWKYPVH